MCKKQTSVSRSCTESQIISLAAGLRMDGLLALDLWDINLCRTEHQSQTHPDKRKQKVDQLSDVDYVLTNTHSSQDESQLCIFEDNEAVIKMNIKGWSSTMRHVSRKQRVPLDWLFDRINSESKDSN